MTRRAFLKKAGVGLAGGALAAPALAQNEPPPYTNRDANGVDLVTGQFGFVMQEGSIGTGENRLELQRILLNGARWTDNWTGTLRRKTVGGNIIVVLEFGAISDSFQLSGGTYQPSKADGSSLVALPFGNFRYTARDGTTIEYQTLDGDGYPVHAPSCSLQAGTQSCGLPVSITKPNGATYSLDWSLRQVCDEDGEGDCPNGQSFSRLMSVRSPSGNRIDFAYGTDDPGIGVPPDAWFTRASATFVGARHRLTLSGSGVAFDAWVAGLAEANLPLRGHLVADVAVVARDVAAAVLTSSQRHGLDQPELTIEPGRAIGIAEHATRDQQPRVRHRRAHDGPRVEQDAESRWSAG